MVAKLVVLLVVAISVARGVDYYKTLDDAYDGSDATVEELGGMLDCLSDTGPCNALGADYRQLYPEVIVQACARCTPLQKRSMCRIFSRAGRELPERYQFLKERHDPAGIYFDSFIASLTGC